MVKLYDKNSEKKIDTDADEEIHKLKKQKDKISSKIKDKVKKLNK